MKSIAEALAALLPSFEPLEPERVTLAEAQGRFLARGLAARCALPPFDNSAMDGYAVRAGELAAASSDRPVRLPVRGESRAGGPIPEALRPGSAMRIFTGAPMPAGADAVVIQEDTRREGDDVWVLEAPRLGQHVRTRGSDLEEGATALAAGSRVGPGEIGLLASQGYAAVEVHRRPRVALLSSGDELRDIEEPERPGTIVNTNAHAVAAQIRAAGGEPWVLPRVPDDLDAIVAALRDALRADLVITTGGVSVGDYDLVLAGFERLGVELDFWKVAIKPGKPIAFGRAGTTPVVGLPGNPISAMVTFEIFLRPALARLLGDPRPHPSALTVQLGRPHRRKAGRTELARATLERRGTRWVAHLLPNQGSGALTSMVGVDAMVILPAELSEAGPDDALLALPLGALPGLPTTVFE